MIGEEIVVLIAVGILIYWGILIAWFWLGRNEE